jgi:CBS domain-containing protein
VSLDANLDEASQLMEHDGLDEIPVVDRNSRRFLGLVTGRHIAQALNRVSVSLSTLVLAACFVQACSARRSPARP